ncbi:MAG: dihydropteroate synthase [Actinomycetota bacterium]
MSWKCRDARLPVGDRTYVMGVLNVTPDSFSDGGQFLDRRAAVDQAERMLAEGADIIDIGGESSRPGAAEVPLEEELNRVIPVVEAIAARTGAVVSIDTTKADVARAACEAGAAIVNDISAMRFDPKMPEVVAGYRAGVVLMHMLGSPRTMQKDPSYADVVAEVKRALVGWAEQAQSQGIPRECIAVDPGIGFGKTVAHNLSLLKATADLRETGYPVLIGASRKSFIGATLDVPVGQRLEGTSAVVAWSVAQGAAIVRVHDVEQMVQVVRMTEAIRNA